MMRALVCTSPDEGSQVSEDDRVNFSPKTKHAIAAAVNWQCSVPLCKIPAIGADDGMIVNGGTACHIFSAAKKGPRGRGGLSDEELEKSSNGLWCCAYHGRVIDANQGVSFPAAQLHMWKRLAEGRVRRAMAVQFAELGWIGSFSLKVVTNSGHQWTCSAPFQKNNLLRGESAGGKTLLLEALASFSSTPHAWRLRKFRKFSIELTYETLTREGVTTVSCESAAVVHRSLNGLEIVTPPPDIAVLYLAARDDRYPNDHAGVKHLTYALGIDEDVLNGLARIVSVNPQSGMTISFKKEIPDEVDSTSEPDDSQYVVYVNLKRHGYELPFTGLSGSEQTQVASALLIALAREEVKSRPVLLCMDALWQLDDARFRSEISKLADEHIQLLIVAPHDLSDDQSSRDFPDWTVMDIPSIQSALAG